MTGLAPTPAATRWRRVANPLGAAGLVGAASLALYLRDPHQHASWGLCPFRVLTGWDCPGCGGLRAVNDLTHGRFLDAWFSNALFITALPVIVLLWVGWLRAGWRGPAELGLWTTRWRHWQRRTWPVLLAVVLAFALLRNLPVGSAWNAG